MVAAKKPASWLCTVCLATLIAPGPLSAQPAVAAEGLRVVSSIYPLALIVREVGGARVKATSLLGPGVSPHAFTALPSDLVRLARADLFVRVGGSMDAWSVRLLAAVASPLPTLTLLSIPGLQPFATSGPVEDLAGLEPHVWLDPLRVRDSIVPALKQLLAELDPDGESYYEDRATRFVRELTALHREIRAILPASPAAGFVAFHPAWRYFASRYGLEELGVVEQSAGQGQRAKRLATLIARARRAGVRAVLVEPQLDARMAAVVAAELSGYTVLVDPLGDARDVGRSTYRNLMLFNARALARALAREGG